MTTAVHPPLADGRRREATPSPSRRSVRTAARAHAVDIGLVAFVTLGAVGRLWALGASKLNYDESFTAMAGRLPLARMFAFLTAHDSHPPLDYLLHAPLARVGADEFWFRFPSALCSIAALALLAVWLRPRGRVAVIATALFAVSAFEIAHGRDARMYAELELIGVGLAMLAETWLRAPKRHHAPLLAALVLTGLYTHVSMFLLAFGLVALAGLRRDRAAWEWRAAIAGAAAVWLVTWGPSFLVQARGGHSSWIPPTTFTTLTTAIGHAVTLHQPFVVGVVLAVVGGGAVLVRRDHTLGRTWLALFAVPVAVGAVAGLAVPVVLDRTFTLIAWAPVVALAFLIDGAWRRAPAVAVAALAVMTVVMVPGALGSITTATGPTAPLTALDRRVQPGDVVAVHPASKAPELQWSLAVRRGLASTAVEVDGLRRSFALRLGHRPATGRVWYLNWRAHRAGTVPAAVAAPCGSTWRWGHTHISCLTGRAVDAGTAAPTGSRPATERAAA